MMSRNVVLEGHALAVLRTLPDDSVDCVITSPPYFNLRAYDAGKEEIGAEGHVDEWVGAIAEICDEIHRVLAPHGNFFLNVGDSYSRHAKFGAPPKSLLAAPDRLLVRLIQAGWCCRNRIVWAKTTPLPSPVGDRLTATWEPIFHLVKQPRGYVYDLDQLRRPLKTPSRPRRPRAKAGRASSLGRLAGPRGGLQKMAAEGRSGHPLGANPGDVLRLPPGRSIGGHPATFPEALVRPLILAGSPEHVCTHCGKPWHRSKARPACVRGVAQPRPLIPCGCGAPTRPGLVLDPFCGSGQALVSAKELSRDALGIELAPRFARLARRRAGLAAGRVP